ncbi:MAG TPA: hypothetical protein VG167_08950 [Verrucomicrobiae bacterium]|nr:hypothetical protein [Verrucomicrobiae bacterium]
MVFHNFALPPFEALSLKWLPTDGPALPQFLQTLLVNLFQAAALQVPFKLRSAGRRVLGNAVLAQQTAGYGKSVRPV